MPEREAGSWTGKRGLRLASLHVYPVKALRGSDRDEARIEPWGLEGDRRWMVVDADGNALTQRTHRRMATVEAIPIPRGLRLRAPGVAEV